jgi:flavin-dependent dehydrogenase
MHKIRGYFDFSNAQLVEKRGGLIPCGGGVSRWSKGHTMLLGDSAGWVSPLTAGGIYPALKVGKAAGEAIANYLQNKAVHPRHMLAPMAPRYASKLLMRKAMDYFQPPNWAINASIGNPLFERLAQAIFFHHRGLKDPKTWKAFVRGTAKMQSP